MKQDNAPVKAQSYSHILFTSKHCQQHRYVLSDGNVAIIMLKVCTVIWHSLLSRKNPATDASPPSHTSVRIAAPAVVLVGTLSRTVKSFSSTSRRNTLGRRNQRRGPGAGLSGLAISAPPTRYYSTITLIPMYRPVPRRVEGWVDLGTVVSAASAQGCVSQWFSLKTQLFNTFRV